MMAKLFFSIVKLENNKGLEVWEQRQRLRHLSFGREDSSMDPVAAGVISLVVSPQAASKSQPWQSTWPSRYDPKGLGWHGWQSEQKSQAS